MRRFNFKLEKILQLRKFKEEECKIALGHAVSILNMIENDLKKTAVKRHHAASQRFADSGEIASWNYYILRLDQEAERLAEQAAQAEIVVEEKRTLYIEALKELKAMEKLKEIQEKEHRKKMLDNEMKEIDDLNSARQFRLNI